MSRTMQYRKNTLIGYCYICGMAHSRDEVTRHLNGGKTHCKECHQPLPESQRLSNQVIWTCNRTGAELFGDHLFHPPIEVEEPVEDDEEQIEQCTQATLVYSKSEAQS